MVPVCTGGRLENQRPTPNLSIWPATARGCSAMWRLPSPNSTRPCYRPHQTMPVHTRRLLPLSGGLGRQLGRVFALTAALFLIPEAVRAEEVKPAPIPVSNAEN